MSDFKIQGGEALADGVTTVTITAGVDYDAPASLSKAFIRIVGNNSQSDGDSGSDFSSPPRYLFEISNPSNLLTSITIEKLESTGVNRISWEIIEYVGEDGGANEFVVLDEGLLAVGSGVTTVDSPVTAPTADSDVMVFITGVQANISFQHGESVFTAEWVAASNLARFTKASSGHTGNISFAIIEFTGSNWSVQRAERVWATGEDGSEQTETISSVTLTKTFSHFQMRSPTNDHPSSVCVQAWLSAATTVSWLMDAAAVDPTSATVTVAWIVSNAQSDGTPAVAARYNGARTTTPGDPDAWAETITAVASLDTTSVFGESATSNAGSSDQVNMVLVSFRLTGTTTVTLSRARDTFRRDWRFETYEWPTAAAGGTPVSNSLAHVHEALQHVEQVA